MPAAVEVISLFQDIEAFLTVIAGSVPCRSEFLDDAAFENPGCGMLNAKSTKVIYSSYAKIPVTRRDSAIYLGA